MTLTLEQEDIRDGLKLNISPIEIIPGRYRMTLKVIDRNGYRLKSAKPIMLESNGSIDARLPVKLNTFYTIFDYDPLHSDK